ncbi:MAG: hypothetical protein WCI56_12830 [Hyphomicrobiales bacterium]
MRYIIAALFSALIWLGPAHAAPSPVKEFLSSQEIVDWINEYRHKPNPGAVPKVVRAISRLGGFKEPEAAGVYIGFIAGVLGNNPGRAEELIEKIFPLPTADHWVIVRAIAYSGAPDWKYLLYKSTALMPTRRLMIDKYMDGRMPTLASLKIGPAPTMMDHLRDDMSFGQTPEAKKSAKKITLEPNQVVLDTLWGYYLGTGSYGPIFRIIELLPWSKDRDHVDRLTVGSMAKYTLASNAARDEGLLSMLKAARKAKEQPKDTVTALNEVIEAAETADTGKIRQEALASIENLKVKGPAYKRDMNTWAKVGQGVIAVGCIVAAATGQVELGIPCVVGGSLTSAAMYYVTDR